MATTSAVSLPVLILLGSIFNGSLLGPPLELDPILSNIAPSTCMLYATSAGIGEADPQSSNHTEQLIAEPEIQHLFREIERQIQSAIARNTGSDRKQRVAASELPKVIKALLSRPFAIFVEDVQVTNAGINAQAGLLLNAGEHKKELKDAIEALLELKGNEGPPINSIDQNNQTWSSMRAGPQFPEIRWGWYEDYFILAVGEGTAEKILERMKGATPSWLEDIRNEHNLEREASLGYLNIEMIIERAKPFLILENVWQYVEKLGLTSVQELHGVAGFDETGCVSSSHLVTDGSREGILSLLPYKPLSKRDLRTIPHDAMLAFAVRIDAKEVFENVLKLVNEFDPNAAEDLERGMREAELEIGVHFKNDLLASLGDAWIAYLPAGDLMSSWLGSAAAVKVKDASSLKKNLDTIMQEIMTKMPESNFGQIIIRESEYEGHSIYYVDVVGEVFPLAPAWCVTEEWLVIGLMPQTVRTAISREMEDSLADREEIKQAFDTNDSPAVISYFDTPRLVQSIYPWLQMGGRVLSGELQKQGFYLDISLLPSQDTIIKHLRPDVGIIAHKSNGFHFKSSNSLPGGGNAVAIAPLMVGLTLPAVQAARSAAREAQEINQLKQLALAFHNYESAHGEFPTNIYDENGKALLSWRVRLLPYMEDIAIHNQFRLDEPWDSAHNLPLSRSVPSVLESPTSPELSAQGKTRFMALAGDETLFPGNKKISFRDVTDGTSNTILFVQAAPSSAVPWSKPEDIQYDAKKPLHGLRWGDKAILAAFNDGACYRIPATISKETFQAMVTRAGGEIVNTWEELQSH